MQRLLSICLTCTLICVLLCISSCKKQDIAFNNQSLNTHLKKKKNDKKIRRAEDIFCPVSVSEAKQFAFLDAIPQVSHEHVCMETVQIDDFSEFVRQKEAKLSDIPVVLNAEPIKNYFHNILSGKTNNITLGYRVSAESGLGVIVTFYRQEMERLGWKQVVFFDSFEKLLVFQKPSRFCVICVRGCLQEQGVASSVVGSLKDPEFLEYAKVIICTQV